jgi:hypothetical protein
MTTKKSTTKGSTKGKAEGSEKVNADGACEPQEYDEDRARKLAAFIVSEGQSDTVALALVRLVSLLYRAEGALHREQVFFGTCRGAFDETDEYHGGALDRFTKKAEGGDFELRYPNGSPFKV